jgi:hypothetical protein
VGSVPAKGLEAVPGPDDDWGDWCEDMLMMLKVVFVQVQVKVCETIDKSRKLGKASWKTEGNKVVWRREGERWKERGRRTLYISELAATLRPVT